ncbi:MAG: hypothetical protein M3M94_04375 [Actinomycetota bacterium]|nr:hypothetical protein [Actinomycetota bacterium]
MGRVIRITLGLALAGVLGVTASCGGRSVSGNGGPPQLSPGEMTPEALETFTEFPLYGLSEPIDGLMLTHAERMSPAVLRKYPPPVKTIGTPRNQPEDRGHKIVPDHVTMIYGDCDPGTDGGCSTPLQIEIWRSCNRYLDDYEAAPGQPLPHTESMVRGTKAADFGGRLEVYAGSVTIVISANSSLRKRVAAALEPLNAAARAETNQREGDLLPRSSPGPDCAVER